MIMAKLYFKYGAMGSSKSAQALIAKYNYEERGMKVWLIKPKTDTRDGANIIKSRIGLFANASFSRRSKSMSCGILWTIWAFRLCASVFAPTL